MLLAGANLQADEFALTGEAMPVRKRAFKGAAEEGETFSIMNIGAQRARGCSPAKHGFG